MRLPRLIGHSRAMDMVLTGRPVGAQEALTFGLANRVVGKGEARQQAERLAAELANLPQPCLREDRASAWEQWDLGFADAMANEFRHGTEALAADRGREGAARFAAGRGRGGSFDDL